MKACVSETPLSVLLLLRPSLWRTHSFLFLTGACVRVYVSAPPPPPSAASASSAATVYKRISQWAQMRRTCRTGGRARTGMGTPPRFRVRGSQGEATSWLMSISGLISQDKREDCLENWEAKLLADSPCVRDNASERRIQVGGG